MPSLLTPSTSEIPIARRMVINVIVVCGAFFQLGAFIFKDYGSAPSPASPLDYLAAIEPALAFLTILAAVRGGWLAWTKEHYDRMRFPLSGAELLSLAGLFSAFCLMLLSNLPILLDAARVNWTLYALLYLAAILGLGWTVRQGSSNGKNLGLGSAIWHALMLLIIGVYLFFNLNMAHASITERTGLGRISGKFITTSKYGRHTYHVDVASPTDPNNIQSLPIDHATWDRKREGDTIKLRLYRGGLGQDYWRYER